MASLEGWGSAIELRPHGPAAAEQTKLTCCQFLCERVLWADAGSLAIA
jgi:hypothetical protein